MKLTRYKQKPQFDPDTGAPAAPKLVPESEKFICDLTGNEIDPEGYCENPLYWLSMEYDHGSEPAWYEDHHSLEEEFGLEYGEISQFFSSPYHFSHTEGYGCSDVTAQICHVWILSLKRQKLPKKADTQFKQLYKEFQKCGTIEQVLRVVRLNTLRRLLREKKYTPAELGFTEYHGSDAVGQMIKDITEGEEDLSDFQ